MHKLYGILTLTTLFIVALLAATEAVFFPKNNIALFTSFSIILVLYLSLSLIYAFYVFKSSVLTLVTNIKAPAIFITKYFKNFDGAKISSFLSLVALLAVLLFSVWLGYFFLQKSYVIWLLRFHNAVSEVKTEKENIAEGSQQTSIENIINKLNSIETKFYEQSSEEFFENNAYEYLYTNSGYLFELSFMTSGPASNGFAQNYQYGLTYCAPEYGDNCGLGIREAIASSIDISQDEVIESFTFEKIDIEMAPEQNFFVVKITTSERYVEFFVYPYIDLHSESYGYKWFPSDFDGVVLSDIEISENSAENFVFTIDKHYYGNEEYVSNFNLMREPSGFGETPYYYEFQLLD